jgi:hypothetical protein
VSAPKTRSHPLKSRTINTNDVTREQRQASLIDAAPYHARKKLQKNFFEK